MVWLWPKAVLPPSALLLAVNQWESLCRKDWIYHNRPELLLFVLFALCHNTVEISSTLKRFKLQQYKFNRFLVIHPFSWNALSVSVWTFKSILTTHLAGDFCLIFLDSFVINLDLPNPAVSEISITLWFCDASTVCLNHQLFMCVNCRCQYIYAVFIKVLAIAAKHIS